MTRSPDKPAATVPVVCLLGALALVQHATADPVAASNRSAKQAAATGSTPVITAPKSATIKIDATHIQPRVYDSDIGDMLPAEELPADVEPEAEDADQPVEVTRWKEKWIRKQDQWGVEGLRFTGKFGLLRMKLGGRLAIDAGKLSQDSDLDRAYPDFDDSLAKLRSAQLQVVGNLGPAMFFKVQYEAAAAGSTGIKDAYVALQDVPFVGNLRLGMGKEPISLESLTSFKFNTFMERSLDTALIPGRSFGVLAHEDVMGQRMTWAAGVFYRSASWGDFEFDTAGGTDAAVRVTGLPYYNPGESLLHLGASLVRRRYASDLQYSSLPESRLTDTRYVDTGSFDANDAWISNVEVVWDSGPFSLQGEYTYSAVSAEGDNPDYSGGYIQGSYYITGEHRPYNPSSATFGRLLPRRPFAWGEPGATGAWEVALRHSSINLDSGSNPGGKQRNTTLGLNWYPGHRTRATVNYIHGKVDSLATGRFNIIQARLLYAF